MENEQITTQDKNYLIPGAIVLAGVLIAGAILYTYSGFNPTPANINSVTSTTNKKGVSTTPTREELIDDDPQLGNPEAPVVFVEFGDFQCPFCGRLHQTVLPQLKEKYIKTGKVLFVYRDFPLSSIHNMAQKSAEASQCAYEQGKFWQYHDILYERQNSLSVQNLKLWAEELGLNTDQFNNCLDSEKYRDEVQKDFNDIIAWGGRGTPAVFINKRFVAGALPWETFESIIEEELKKVDK